MAKGEIGRIGQKRYGGVFYEEFIKDLRGKKGVEAFQEMSENDDIVGSILFAIEMLIRQVSWNIEPGGDSETDKKAAEFVEQCLNDMEDTWTDTLSDILSFLAYGWSFHEIVYKRRIGKKKRKKLSSKYDDCLIGWAKLPIRSQESLYQWEYDNEDYLLGMTQMPTPDYALYTIPMEKAILFRTRVRKGNPEGRSILRNAYRSWYFKKRIQEIEGIGIERDLAGLPVIHAPEEHDIWDDTNAEGVKIRARLESLVRSIRRDSLEGLVLPTGFEFELASSGGKRQFDTSAIIERYDTRIAMTALADFIMLGHQKVGSFALNDGKTEIFSVAIGAFVDIICECFNNQAIPSLIDINGDHFRGITDYPHMTHGDIEAPKLNELSAFIKDMTGIGVLIPDEGLEDFVREIGKLPERVHNDNNAVNRNTRDINEDEVDTGAVVEEAKKRLGRTVKGINDS